MSREPSPLSLEQAATLFRSWGIAHDKHTRSLANYLDGYRDGVEHGVRSQMTQVIREIVETYDVGDRLGADPVIEELKRLIEAHDRTE